MADNLYGYRKGPRVPVKLQVDGSTSDIKVGDMLSLATAGYFQQISAGEIGIAVAMQEVDSPTSDGDVYVLADISRESVYEYAPDAGTVTQALVGVTMDVGGPQTIDIDASTDDVIECVEVDTDANTLFIRLRPTFSGVV